MTFKWTPGVKELKWLLKIRNLTISLEHPQKTFLFGRNKNAGDQIVNSLENSLEAFISLGIINK